MIESTKNGIFPPCLNQPAKTYLKRTKCGKKGETMEPGWYASPVVISSDLDVRAKNEGRKV
jgi:hypothetical protein